ncbi:NVEALA domain-containing protein [Parabacteroides distasonis]|uniref:NVEALA domain-containing protein n=1 Tax=Parabacteroides distasonis TaxID=823 RepID=UPI00321997B6
MKQITFKKAFAIIFICALCASYFLLKEGKQNFTDLTFSNIEALASGESGSGDCMGLALYHVMEDITNIYTTVKITHELLRVHSSINR